MFAFSNYLNPSKLTPFSTTEVIIATLQHFITYSSFILLIVFIITVLSVKSNWNSKHNASFFNLVKYINITLIGIILFCVLFKFILFLWNIKSQTLLLISSNYITAKFNYLPYRPFLDLNNSFLSDAVILLAFSSGLVCIYLLGEKNLTKHLSNISIFSIFLVAIIAMVYTTNLLVMFIGFECLFVPTLYYVFTQGYVQRADKTLKVLLCWTLLGAFMVLSSLAYLYYKYKTLQYFQLVSIKFSTQESFLLYMFIFLGFGIKVPVFPFHYWLTKIHVEAPAGFSIFLSGFLVKAALYCFYYFNLIFESKSYTYIVVTVAIFGVVESSFKMWNQTDFKKLIAFATIQEMNLILLLLVSYQNILDYSLVLFILIHGWLSTLMFYLVDVIQKKTNSRNIVEISGLAYKFPEIRFIVWFIIIFFTGFPLTVKFVIEWAVLSTLILQHQVLFMSVFFVIVAFGAAGFTKQMLIILYGMARYNINVNHTLAKRDKRLLYLIIFILVALNAINFFLS